MPSLNSFLSFEVPSVLLDQGLIVVLEEMHLLADRTLCLFGRFSDKILGGESLLYDDLRGGITLVLRLQILLLHSV